MRINTALILCAGLGKRLNPITLTTPKPLLKIGSITILEKCIDLVIRFGAKKIIVNTFHLSDQIFEFIQNKKFPIDIQIIEDGKEILDTGGGILNMIEKSEDNDFIIFNPDTLWDKNYIDEINKMQNFYFSNKLNNLLLLANKKLSFDKNLKGDFELTKNLLKKNNHNDFIYIGCQILNRNLFEKYKINRFSILEIWNELLKNDELNGFESFNKFFHLTNLETFKKLKDS
jgi:N-acetyl-alpha-D-muramate 1-phosphate uridylyltransferase